MIVLPPTRHLTPVLRQAYTRTRWASLFLMAFGVASGLGCADDGLGAPAGGEPLGPSALGGDPFLGRACVEGATRACHLVLGEHAGVISCYEGTETCTDGAFSPCADGEMYEVNRSELEDASSDMSGRASLRPLAFSTPTTCTDNPCNRYCREFEEAPVAGLTPELDGSAPPLSTWTTGSVSDYPLEWLVLGVREPCHVAGDCQLNTECTDPALGSCSHSVCASGEPLEVGCNRCADTVCAADASCCATPLECAHDPCDAFSGAPLDPSCDTCVAAVCDVHPECCNVTWNEACVGYVATECAPLGQSCGCPERSVESAGRCYLVGDEPRDFGLSTDACAVFGGNWNLIEVDDASENAVAQGFITSEGLASAWLGGNEFSVDTWEWQSRPGEVFFISDALGGTVQPPYTYANWASGEPELGVVGRVILMSADGSWRDAERTNEHDFICEGPPNRLTPLQTAFAWDAGCVELARVECGVRCPDNNPLGLGSCNPRVATALDPECASFDLALGATCEDVGVPQIPVCNHGQLAAPAGLRLTHVDVSDFGKDAPTLADAVDCVLSEPIPPGRCVTVTDCPGLTPDRALVVNPADGGEDASECRFDDNWTIFQPVTCRPALCEAGLHDARQVERNDCGIAVQHPLTIDTAGAVVTLGTGVPEPVCAAGEIRWGASCYFFARDVQTWDAAQDRCQDRGAGWDLVALNSPAENTWVRSGTAALEDVQIGLNDKLIEGAHAWSNGTCTSWTNWHTSSLQPNDFPPGGEQCARMTAFSGAEWEDKPCNDGEHPYVCEGPVLDAQGGCAAGQTAGPDGKCYAFDATLRAWSDARDVCDAMGPGWALPVIDAETTNDFVSGLLGCSSAWLNNPPGNYSHWAPAESVNLSNDPYIDEIGFWHTSVVPLPRATLCQGPATATGAPVLSQVAELVSCTNDNQYYFEGSGFAPERLELCPATCTRAVSVPDRRIDVEIPCAPPIPPAIETTVAEMYYESDCEGGGAIWDFFYYDAVTPADSRIEFEIRTASSIAQLAADTVPFVPIAAAHAVPTDTQRCDVSPPDCPIDIFTALGTTGQQQSTLELLVRLIPGSSGEGPLLRDWKVRFSCPPSQ